MGESCPDSRHCHDCPGIGFCDAEIKEAVDVFRGRDPVNLAKLSTSLDVVDQHLACQRGLRGRFREVARLDFLDTISHEVCRLHLPTRFGVHGSSKAASRVDGTGDLNRVRSWLHTILTDRSIEYGGESRYGKVARKEFFVGSRMLVRILDPRQIRSDDGIEPADALRCVAQRLQVIAGETVDPASKDVLEEGAACLEIIIDASNRGQLDRCFVPASDFILNAIRVQRPKSSSQIQLFMSFGHLCRLRGHWAGFYEIMNMGADTCDRIIKKLGKNVPREFDSGVSMCRLLGFFETNLHLFDVYWKYTSAGQAVFGIRDYTRVEEAVNRFCTIVDRFDNAPWLGEYLVGFMSHMVLGVDGNRMSGQRTWEHRFTQLIRSQFCLPHGLPDMERLVEAALLADGPWAVRRNLEGIELILGGIPDISARLRFAVAHACPLWRPVWRV